MNLKLSYMRPLLVRSGTIVVTGRVMKLGRQLSYNTESFVYAATGIVGAATLPQLSGLSTMLLLWQTHPDDILR